MENAVGFYNPLGRKVGIPLDVIPSCELIRADLWDL